MIRHKLTIFKETNPNICDRGNTVVKAVLYKSEGRWFDSRWYQWNFSLT